MVAGVVLIAAFLALLAYGLLSSGTSRSISEDLSRGRPAPAPPFDLPLLQPGAPGPRLTALRKATADGRISLAELRGVPVVLNFWASWCPPCATEAPRLEHGWQSARRQGVLFLGLNMQDVTSDARAFLSRYRASYPNIRDQGDEVSRQWGVTGLPETFFISASGRVVGKVIGAISARQLQRGVHAAKSGRVIGDREGGARQATRGG